MVSNSYGGGTVTASSHPPPGVEAVLESCPDALLVISEDGTIRLVNAATERMFGYTRGELVGQDHRMLLAEGFRSGFHRIFFALRREADAEPDAINAATEPGAGSNPTPNPNPATPSIPPVEA
ncbi:MAG TPA: PAS domain S-box protein, partial [Arthrobacter sp.]|nr:PAS domain S-box protein [Arthrobacter sp.]